MLCLKTEFCLLLVYNLLVDVNFFMVFQSVNLN